MTYESTLYITNNDNSYLMEEQKAVRDICIMTINSQYGKNSKCTISKAEYEKMVGRVTHSIKVARVKQIILDL